ncbi:MAG: hypothetical protein M3319_14770 [Actinomycetota bacterium]|nr:hypothetical protein [Actinomycetota bacterium]MDQ3901637.1 hypothetical protein [Actinomycetota bacterium]
MTHKKGSEVVRIERPDEAPKVCQDVFDAGALDGLVNLFEPEAVVFLGPNQAIAGSGKIREVFAAYLEAGWRWESS